MNPFKSVLTTLLTSFFLNYTKTTGYIILPINLNLKKWEIFLMQLVLEKRYLLRYRNKIWFSIEKEYNITK